MEGLWHWGRGGVNLPLCFYPIKSTPLDCFQSQLNSYFFLSTRTEGKIWFQNRFPLLSPLCWIHISPFSLCSCFWSKTECWDVQLQISNIALAWSWDPVTGNAKDWAWGFCMQDKCGVTEPWIFSSLNTRKRRKLDSAVFLRRLHTDI